VFWWRTPVGSDQRDLGRVDLESIGDQSLFRSELELDSLDFLALVETVSEATGVRIDEADYPRLAPIDSCVALIAGH